MRRARVRRLAAVAAACWLPIAAAAQHEAASPTSPDVPTGPATVIGRLVHDTRPEAAANAEVILYALTADGRGGLRQGTTDADGTFRFEGVSNEPGVVYLVGARAGEIPFGKRFTFAPGATEHEVEVAISDPVDDPDAAQHGVLDVRLERGCTHLRVSHAHTVTNPGDRVVYVSEDRRGETPPIFEVVLPEGAEGFETLMGRDGLEREGDRVRFWGPSYPGTQTIEYGYGLPIDTERIALGLPRGAEGVKVLTPEGVVTVASEALAPAPGVAIEETPHLAQRADAIAPGGTFAFSVSLAERADSGVRTPRAELWLELDDAALEVNERLELVVEEDGGLAESPEAPLLCLPLPAGALDLRFSPETLSAGLRRDPSGDLAIHGPLPQGATPLALSYRLPATGDGADLVRQWDRPLPLLSMLVADTGVVPETTRMHRRRSVRSDERMFQYLEAFAIEPGERVEVDLRRTAPQRSGEGWAGTAFAVLAGVASLGFLAAPLRAGADASGEAPPAPFPDEAAELERHGFAKALADLDDDLETGKLTPDDHAAMRAELRARAAARLLDAPAAAPAATPAPAACASCGTASRAGDRFCAHCGSKLDSGTPA